MCLFKFPLLLKLLPQKNREDWAEEVGLREGGDVTSIVVCLPPSGHR